MGIPEGVQVCGGCSFCCAWVAYIVCGSLALKMAFDDASRCDEWWLWGTFVGELIYVPFAIFYGGIYGAMASAAIFCMEEEDITSGSLFTDGCFQGFILVILNILSGVIIGMVAHSVWVVDEQCVEGTWLHSMALFGFWACAIITGINLVLSALKFCKTCTQAEERAHA